MRLAFAFILFAPPAVAVLMLSAVWQRRLYRFRVRAWVAERRSDRAFHGALMLYIAGDPEWHKEWA